MISAPLRSRASTTTVAAAEAGDDAIPRREAPRRGLDAGRVLGDDRARVARSGGEAPRARADSRGRSRSRARRSSWRPPRARPMRGSPSTPRARPRDDDEPGRGQLAAELRATCEPYAEQARAPTIATVAGRARSRLGRPAYEEPGRRIVDRPEKRRKAGSPRATHGRPASRDVARYAALVERPREAPNAAVRGGSRTICAPCAAANAASARSLTPPSSVRRAVGERLSEVLGADLGAFASAAIVAATRATRARPRPESGNRSTAR